jgi:ACS family pantothenate transporter-like MFS transporter
MASKSQSIIGSTGLGHTTSITGIPDSTSPILMGTEKAQKTGTFRRSLRTFQRYVWDDADKPKDEKWFLFKLDVFLLTAACLGYFSKNLDQANIANAYVSGVSKDCYRPAGILT